MSDDNHKEEKEALRKRDSFTRVGDIDPQPGERVPIEGCEAHNVAMEILNEID